MVPEDTNIGYIGDKRSLWKILGRSSQTREALEVQFSSVQLLSRVRLFAIPWMGTAAHQASLSITNSWSLLKTHVHEVGDAIQPSHPLSSLSPPTFNLFQHQGLSSESVLCIRWPKYWSFRFSISIANEYS